MFRTLIVLPLLASSIAFASPPPASASKPASTEAKPAETKPEDPEPTDSTATAPVVEQTPSFVVLDKDLDARLTTSEVAELDALSSDFATVDADKDGTLSRSEYAAWTELHGEKNDTKGPAKEMKRHRGSR